MGIKEFFSRVKELCYTIFGESESSGRQMQYIDISDDIIKELNKSNNQIEELSRTFFLSNTEKVKTKKFEPTNIIKINQSVKAKNKDINDEKSRE